MDLQVAGKAFVVSGGTRGLGHAVAQSLISDGAQVVIGGRDQARASASAAELGGRNVALGIAADLTDPGAETRLLGACAAAYGRIDGVCISNGGPRRGSALDLSDDDWHAAFNQVFLGAMRLARATAKTMTTEGSILFILSTSVREPIDGLSLSNGLRPGLAAMVHDLAQELAPRSIRVNGILPGRIDTDRIREIEDATGRPTLLRRDWEKRIPLQRYGRAEEVGAAGAFLLSPAASYITGTLLTVDGGLSRSI